MSAIFEFFEKIGSFFNTVINLVVTVFEDIIFVMKLMFDTLSNFSMYVSWLPSAVISVVITGITVVVIYKVVGRD